MTGDPVRRETQRHGHTDRRSPCGERGRDCRDVSSSQGMWRLVSNCQKQAERNGMDPPGPSRRNQSANTFTSGFQPLKP